MRIFIFKSEANRTLRAFAGEPGGRELPSKFGPWHAVGVVGVDKQPPHRFDRAVIEAAIASQGFQLYRMKDQPPAAGR
jgi:hypothetical protein